MKTFGLIGKKLSHSFSKKYFEKKFSAEGLSEYKYLNFEINSVKELKNLLKKDSSIQGLNITLPYKEAILPILDEKSEAVNQIGAANTVKVRRNNDITLSGFNTDAEGFKQSLLSLIRKRESLSALILGSGGASKAVQHALSELLIPFKIVSRKSNTHFYSYKQLDHYMIEKNLLIINTTPVGMHPNSQAAPEIPYGMITQQHICFDLIYNPEKTMFLTRCENQGAIIKNGLEMLHLQAELSWKIWNDDML